MVEVLGSVDARPAAMSQPVGDAVTTREECGRSVPKAELPLNRRRYNRPIRECRRLCPDGVRCPEGSPIEGTI